MDRLYERMRVALRAVERELGDVRGVAESSDGLVGAVVDGRGRLVDLWLDPRIYRRPHARGLATLVNDTVREAARAAAADAYQLTTRAFAEEGL